LLHLNPDWFYLSGTGLLIYASAAKGGSHLYAGKISTMNRYA